MSPYSAKFKADLHGSSVGRSTEGMFSSFLTFFCCILVVGHFSLATTSFLKAVISGGRGEGPLGPLLRSWLRRLAPKVENAPGHAT
jgi:hypothetical protein